MISSADKYEKYRPKKFLGQNFLVDENIAGKIVESLNIKTGDTIIEIGPGQGSLTKYICKLAKNFYAIEIDRSIVENLKKEFKDTVNLIHGDFLKIDLSDIKADSKKMKIIGNIPYNITSEILFKLYNSDIIESAILMMQKEVAARLTAKPGTKDYGILAVQTQLNASAKVLFNVPPAAFFPKPGVVSSVVKLDFTGKRIDYDRDTLRSLVRQSFGQRRKTMKNSLKKFFESNGISFEEIDFNFTRRPESVSVEEFVDLSKKVSVELQKQI